MHFSTEFTIFISVINFTAPYAEAIFNSAKDYSLAHGFVHMWSVIFFLYVRFDMQYLVYTTQPLKIYRYSTDCRIYWWAFEFKCCTTKLQVEANEIRFKKFGIHYFFISVFS